MPNRSIYWDTMVDILDNQFPKGKCKERGKALVMLSYIELMLQGVEFEDGKPKEKVEPHNPECERACACTGEREKNHTLCKKCENNN